MSAPSQIEQAIGTHGLFKLRLRNAIASGRLEGSVATLGSHVNCPFGKWLASAAVAPATKATPQYQAVDLLHAKFHLCAAKVAQMAIEGRADEATAALEREGEFGIAASELTAAMQVWKQSMAASPRVGPRLSVQVAAVSI